MMLSNKNLVIPYSTFHTHYNALVLGQTSVALSIVRACARLKGVYVSFNKPGGLIDNFQHPSGAAWKPANDNKGYEFVDAPLTCQISLGAKTFPVMPITSVAEFFQHLRVITGCHNQSLRTLRIDKPTYEKDKFIIGMSMEKVPGSSTHSGINTRSGDLIRISLTGLAGIFDADVCDAL
jgi:hypothetical protein